MNYSDVFDLYADQEWNESTKLQLLMDFLDTHSKVLVDTTLFNEYLLNHIDDLPVDWNEHYDGALCPDCNTPIPSYKMHGEECENCQFVFYTHIESNVQYEEPQRQLDDPNFYRVTYFSAFQKPEHHENLTRLEAHELEQEGKDQQFKTILTRMDEEQPTTF